MMVITRDPSKLSLNETNWFIVVGIIDGRASSSSMEMNLMNFCIVTTSPHNPPDLFMSDYLFFKILHSINGQAKQSICFDVKMRSLMWANSRRNRFRFPEKYLALNQAWNARIKFLNDFYIFFEKPQEKIAAEKQKSFEPWNEQNSIQQLDTWIPKAGCRMRAKKIILN